MSLGLVATGKRSLKDGSSFDKYFTAAEGNEVQLLGDGDVYDTLSQMKKIVRSTLSQTKAIAPMLRGSTTEATCRNVWRFLYDHVQYKKDHPLREQLRTPSRTWRDRKTGVDCDCYTIFISSVLTNLKIPHAFRMAGYKGEFQHVYVVVPKNGKTFSDRSSYWAIDPVVNQFNYEAPYSKKHDHKMSQINMLNGLGECNTKPELLRLRPFLPTQDIIAMGGVVTVDFLTENKIPFVPSFDKANDRSVYVVQTPTGFLVVPTVMSPKQSEDLKAMVGPCVAPASSAASLVPSDTMEQLKEAAKKFNWWWLAIFGAGWLLLTGGDQKEVKSGLDGVPGAKKKYKTISI